MKRRCDEADGLRNVLDLSDDWKILMNDTEDASAESPSGVQLPRSFSEWLQVFGPGAIIASLTIGTGELIFSTRGGALFGFDILFVFATISLLKWGLVASTSRHMVLTGVHPYERMMDLPGPRGWMPVALLLMAAVCLPVWISFHSGVVGNLTSWITGTRSLFNGGMDYIWGSLILVGVLTLTALGGYSILERVQLFVVGAMVLCAVLSLILYRPDWIQLLLGFVPKTLSYPDWLSSRYPEIARDSVWVETTRYVGVIGGAGFDYLAYTSWLREKRWGVLPGRPTPEELDEIANNPGHPVRKWIRAPMIDCAISFALIIAFSAVFVASGAIVLGTEQLVPGEKNLLNLQSQFVTRIHPLLLPLYVVGTFLTMLGTLYGTIEVACAICSEIGTAISVRRTPSNLRKYTLLWCAPLSLLILGWLFVRQAQPLQTSQVSQGDEVSETATESDIATESTSAEPKQRSKPRILLALLTPVNLFTGVLACGLICLVVLWMDRRWLPPKLQPPIALTALNVVSAVVFVGLGLKGFWHNENREVVVGSLLCVFVVAMIMSAVTSRGARPDRQAVSK